MIARGLVLGPAIVLCGWVAPARSGLEDRPAAAILAEINAGLPERPKDVNDKAARDDYMAKYELWRTRRMERIGELNASHPEAPELAELLPWRWTGQSRTAAGRVVARAEIEAVIARSKDEKAVASAYYGRAMLAINAEPELGLEEVMPAIEDLCRRYPKDERGASLLMVATNRATSLEAMEKIWDRVARDYPGPKMARSIELQRSRAEKQLAARSKIGQPFRLEFVDAIKGTPVSMEKLRGKVVVVDFWATWCGPCLGDISHLKKLYAEYKDKGVEFIGISLDQPVEKGGLAKLKDCVASNGIEWPQFYQGNYWRSEFSESWGIHAIPTVFLVDADGNLASIEARGKLEKLIPEYLEKARAKATP